MATIDAYSRLTLLERASRSGDQNVLEIAEILAQTNPILNDIPFREANNKTVEKVSRRVALPTGTYRQYNEGVAVEASQTEQVIETTAMLESRSETDQKLVDQSGDPKGFRASEDVAFVEGLGQTAATTLIYGNAVLQPAKFTGFAPRLNALANDNVYGAGGTGSDLTSIYVAKWGPQWAYGIFPSGTPVGLTRQDLGVVDATDANSKKFRAYSTLFQWDMGLAVKDNRAIRRIANIETAGSTNIFDEDLLIQALNDLPGGDVGAVVYCNKTLKTQMDIWAKDKSNVSYTADQVGGVNITMFRGVPVRRVDAILNTESAVA